MNNTHDTDNLAWLADAPLFIDAQQVSAFYDAVVAPEFEHGEITLTVSESTSRTTSVEGSAGIEVGTAAWLKTIFPFLDAKVKAEAAGSLTTDDGTEDSTQIVLRRISTPQRQLVHLALHYAVNLPDRMHLAGAAGEPTWASPAFVQAVPRGLVFLDLPPVRLIPTAAELANGKIVTFFDKFIPGEEPDYVEPGATEEERQANSQQYWSWFDRVTATRAMETVEEVLAEHGVGRARWIDFRLPIEGLSVPLHLHVNGRETVDTGVFAYNMIKRGSKHGLRIVGSIKSEPDLNVLAVFDK